MKLYILRPKEFVRDDENPWEPWYDKAFGFVVSAESEENARKIAQKHAGDEAEVEGYKKSKTIPWMHKAYSTCEELIPMKEELIMQDFYSA